MQKWDLEYGWVRNQYEPVLDRGEAFDFNFQITDLAQDATHHTGFVLGSDPLIIFGLIFVSNIDLIEWEIRTGGAFSGGTPVPINRRNELIPLPSPLPAAMSEGVTIDTPGTIRDAGFSESAKGATSTTGPSRQTIVAPGTEGYISLKNADGKAARFTLTWIFGIYR